MDGSEARVGRPPREEKSSNSILRGPEKGAVRRRATRATVIGAAATAVAFVLHVGASGCASDETEPRKCGPGTVKSGGQCVLEDASVGGAGGGSGGGVGGGGAGGSAGSGGTGGGAAGSGGVGGAIADGGADADAGPDVEGGCGELSPAWHLFDAGSGPALPSCTSGALGAGKNCGLNANEDCCESRGVPCGKYDRSNDPLYPAYVSSFRLDKFEVTVGRFRPFVEQEGGTKAKPPAAGAGAHPIASGTGWQAAWNSSLPDNSSAHKQKLKCYSDATWTDTPGQNERHPITCVDWYTAFAFCIWDGGRLPTESEWNYVAASGPAQRLYPWGSTTIGDSVVVWQFAGPAAVGSRPAGYADFWRNSDLAGNAWEWVFDFWFPWYSVPCVDCANINPHVSGVRALRGGGYTESDPKKFESGHRSSRGPTDRVRDVGFRCARAL